MKSKLFAALVLLATAGPALGDEIVFTVGGDKAKGKELAEAHGGKWAKSLTKGFKNVSKQLEGGGEMTVVLRVAGGDYDGDLGAGAFELPSFRNEKATLRFEGGYSADFSARDPFGTPTRIVTVDDRSLPLFTFYNSRNFNVDQDVVQAFTLDGFLFDTAKSNNYDPESNSLIMRGTSTWPLIRFRNFRMDMLEIKNCVFMNSPHRAFETLVRPLTQNSKIRLFNNLFINCLYPLKLDFALTRDSKVASFEVDHCSFLVNWGANADPTSGNPCPLEWGSEAETVAITNCLFYANFGGAILGTTPTRLTLNNNDFVGNGLLHGQPEPGAVAMIVEAGGKKHPVDVDTLEDVEFVEEAEDNVSISPGINLSLGDVKPVDTSGAKADESWENDARRLLGKPLQGGKVEPVKNFAPRKEWDPANPPFPSNPEAKQYGASPDLVGQ